MKNTNKRSLNQVIVEIQTMIEFLQQEAMDEESGDTAMKFLIDLRDKLDRETGYSEMQGFGPEDR